MCKMYMHKYNIYIHKQRVVDSHRQAQPTNTIKGRLNFTKPFLVSTLDHHRSINWGNVPNLNFGNTNMTIDHQSYNPLNI